SEGLKWSRDAGIQESVSGAMLGGSPGTITFHGTNETGPLRSPAHTVHARRIPKAAASRTHTTRMPQLLSIACGGLYAYGRAWCLTHEMRSTFLLRRIRPSATNRSPTNRRGEPACRNRQRRRFAPF